MPKLIFVNLPVADLAAAKAFYEAIGFTNNPQFTDETAACMVLTDVIHVMLVTHEKFAQFTPKRIADANAVSEVLICVSEDSREGVDAITEKALAAGGREPREKQDYGFMYGRSFEDLDGHIWEPMYMDMKAATAAMARNQPETTDA
jgi:predicted lactoylglutathione lyase